MEKKGIKTIYVAKKSIDVTEKEATEVEIEFIPKKENMILPLTWQFKVQGGAEKPVFSKDQVPLFTINDVGGLSQEPLPKELLDNLTTNSTYTYVIDTDKVALKVGWYKKTNDTIKHTIFEVDRNPTTVLAAKDTNAYSCKDNDRFEYESENQKYKSIFAIQDKDGKNLFGHDLTSYEDAQHNCFVELHRG